MRPQASRLLWRLGVPGLRRAGVRPVATTAYITDKELPKPTPVPDELLDKKEMPVGWKAPIVQAKGATFSIWDEMKFRMAGRKVTLEGPNGVAHCVLPPTLQLALDKETGVVSVLKTTQDAPANTFASILRNFGSGVMLGHQRKLSLQGIGYRARKMDESEGKGREALEIRCGFSHPVFYVAPAGVRFEVPASNDQIVVKGVDLAQVGRAAAEIRNIQPPNVYTGKGIRYSDEEVKLKSKRKK